MGFGELIRNITVTQTDTVTGEYMVETIVTGAGAYGENGFGTREFRGLLGVPSAWRCTQLISDIIGGIPWHAYDDVIQPDGSFVSQRRFPNPTLLERPAVSDTCITTYSSWAMDLVWHGNAIGIVWERDQYGEPAITVPVPAEYAFVKRVGLSDNLPAFIPGETVYMIGTKYYKVDDVIHIKGLCRPGYLRGLGVLEQHMPVLALDLEQRKQAASATGAGVPIGILKSDNPDLEQAEADEISAAWHAKQNARRVAVLNASTTFEPLAWNPTESQLLDARKFGNVEIAQVFGIDPEWLGAQQSSRTYRNMEQSGIELIRNSSLHGHLSRFEQALSSHLRPGSKARANLDSIQRADTLGRYQAHQIGLASGFITDDEVRAIENMPPLTPAQRAEIAKQQAAAKPTPPVAPDPAQGAPDDNKGGKP